MKAHRDPATYRRYLEKSGIRWLVFHTAYAGERDQTLAYYRGVTDVDQVYDLDRYYGLGLRRLAPGLSAPDIFVLRLRN